MKRHMMHKPRVTGNKRAPAEKGDLLLLCDYDLIVLVLPSFPDVLDGEVHNNHSRQHDEQVSPLGRAGVHKISHSKGGRVTLGLAAAIGVDG